MSQAFAYLIQVFAAKQCYIVPPDNLNKYDHIVIPPGKELSDIFDYLQDTYGCYNKGCEWYYTDNTLFIYPGFENQPKIPYIANIFNSFAGMYGGHKSYHSIQGNTTSIVSNVKAKTKDLTHMAAENEGTSRTFLRATMLIDNYSTTSKHGTVIAKNPALMVGNPSISPVIPGASYPKYQKPTDNIFKVNTNIAKNQAVLITLGWQQAILYAFKPGHKIKYFFDNNNVFTVANGILESVKYKVEKTVKLGPGQVYKCTCDLQFRVDPIKALTQQSN